LAIVSLREQAKNCLAGRVAKGVHAAITENELADARVVAAEFPALIEARFREWETRTGAPRVANWIMAVEDAAIPRIIQQVIDRHMLFSHEKRVAESISNLFERKPTDWAEHAVGRE
jgi:hypothetical protein